MGTSGANERSGEPDDERDREVPQRDRGHVRVHSPVRESTPGERLVLTVSEAAELLGISRAFAYELVARGELPVIRLGRRRLVPRRALLALVDQEPSGVTLGFEG